MNISICTLNGNKITYNYETIKYTELQIEQIINTINGSKILVFDDLYFSGAEFVKTKVLRFFKGETYNLEQTTYIVWCLKYSGCIINYMEIFLNLPKSIKYIRFNNYFNQSVQMIPEGITHIIFGNEFNKSVDCLPFTIEYLFFGINFNQPIDNLPGCLKKLIFNEKCNFSQPVDNLPNFLEYLFLPLDYSNQLDNLPNFLSELMIGFKYPHCLNNLPNSIKKFSFYQGSPSNALFPSKISSLNKISKTNNFKIPSLKCYYEPKKNDKLDYIDKVFVRLPKELVYLDLTYSYKLNYLSEVLIWNTSQPDTKINLQKELVKKNLPLDNLPENITVLKFPSNYAMIQIETIPKNIIRLFLSNTFNSSVDKLLNPHFGTSKPRPETKLTHLVFGEEFNQSVNYLPPSLTHLFFGYSFNKSVDALPNKLLFISFGNQFNKTIDNLPHGITEIEFGYNFSQSIDKLSYKVETIIFKRKEFAKNNLNDTDKIKLYNIKINKLPSNLKKIYLPNYYDFNDIYNKDNENKFTCFKGFEQYVEYYK